MNVPGMAAEHLVITNNCRRLHGDTGAFDEAVRRARKHYDTICKGRGLEKGLEIHLVLVVQLPRHREKGKDASG